MSLYLVGEQPDLYWCPQVRADLNVPLNKDLEITDDTRIRAAIPTLKYLTDNGAKVLLTSHLVRTEPYAGATSCSPVQHTFNCSIAYQRGTHSIMIIH